MCTIITGVAFAVEVVIAIWICGGGKLLRLSSEATWNLLSRHTVAAREGVEDKLGVLSRTRRGRHRERDAMVTRNVDTV